MNRYLAPLLLALVLLSAAAPFARAQGAGIEWETLNQEVRKLLNAGQYDQALPLASKALQVAEQNVGPDHPDMATSLNNLALVYSDKADYAAAEPLHKRAIAINEKALGKEHPYVAISLENLARLYRKTGRAADAEPLERRAKAIRAKQ